jgi:membrane-bound serine protease (ClpP class)
VIWTAIAVLLLAFLLLFLELMVPSFGTLALASLACFGTAVALAFGHSAEAGFVFTGIVVVGIPLGIWLGVKLFKKSPMGKRMILAGPTQNLGGGGAGFAAQADLAGKEGLASTVLRPSGIAEIAGRRVDVVAEGRFIEAGERIRVIKVEGNRVVVEPAGGPGPGPAKARP